jgi:hypothetical protein
MLNQCPLSLHAFLLCLCARWIDSSDRPRRVTSAKTRDFRRGNERFAQATFRARLPKHTQTAFTITSMLSAVPIVLSSPSLPPFVSGQFTRFFRLLFDGSDLPLPGWLHTVANLQVRIAPATRNMFQAPPESASRLLAAMSARMHRS